MHNVVWMSLPAVRPIAPVVERGQSALEGLWLGILAEAEAVSLMVLLEEKEIG